MPSNISIPLAQIKLGKHKQRSQMCEVLTDDGRWVDIEIPAKFSCVDDEHSKMAFLLDPENQYWAEDNNWHQLLTEKSQLPLALRKQSVYQDGQNDEKEISKLGNDLFRLTWYQKKMEQFEKIKQSEVWNKLVLIVTIMCVTILIIVAIRYLKGGG